MEVTVEDVMKKFRFSKNTALIFMKNEELHSYYLGAPLYCSRKNFDNYINKLNDCGWKSYGATKRTERKEIINTLEPVIKARDIMLDYSVCKGTALKIMGHKELCSYRPTPNMFVCERQYYEEFIDELEYTGGIKSLSIYTETKRDFCPIIAFMEAVCTDEEFERLIKNGFKRINHQ